MNREEKHELVSALQEKMQEFGNFYIADTSSLSVAKVNNIRRKCFESGIEMQVAKNSLIRKAIEGLEGSLVTLKTREELIGDIIGLLQSPAKNVISALKSSGSKIAGIVKTLQEREG
ncbi:MAG: 50S ribosomal protein L10 [Pedobacter sp.]|nr:MAG: 50S ribosomal protein L10 [Pedobacter sp.]